MRCTKVRNFHLIVITWMWYKPKPKKGREESLLLDNVNRKIRTGFISLNLRFKIYVDFAFIEVFCEFYFIKYEIFCREVRKKK